MEIVPMTYIKPTGALLPSTDRQRFANTASHLVDVSQAAISRRDAVNSSVNAVIHKMDNIAREVVEAGPPPGPFNGVPFLLKDLGAAYAGVPMTNGSRAFRNYIPDYDSELVKRFKSSGLVIFGKTNCPELAIFGATEPELHGKTLNPWNPECTAGGPPPLQHPQTSEAIPYALQPVQRAS
jgi:Asp-tRNA(Asn)/Glu-tRNA(Gln) amidotransferase A subunit family amidase